jgi:hypothetical protein
MKYLTIFLISVISLTLIISGCGLSEKDMVGKEFNMNDGFHVIEFKEGGKYYIYQKPHNCGGNGSWSISDGKIKLGSNDSNCESTQNIAGIYNASDFK